MSILSVKNLEKKFGDLTVLKDISFDINDGEIISIIGSSGSGKSTLLRCMNQLETITHLERSQSMERHWLRPRMGHQFTQAKMC